MGKLLPTPYPGQSMIEYREQLINFQKNYWKFLKPSKSGSKFIPLPPEHLKPKEMKPNIIPVIAASNKRINESKKMSRKLSEHVEDELFNKEKRVIPSVDPKKVIKTTPKIVKESPLGSIEDKPVKKKRPYYRKKYIKPTPLEVFIPEPVNTKKHFIYGLLTGIIFTIIIFKLISFFS